MSKEGHGIISPDIIPAPIRRATKGRTISLANRDCSYGAIHPPEGNMSEGRGIMSTKKTE